MSYKKFRAFIIAGGVYQELHLTEPKVWMSGIELGLGLWQGVYQGIDRLWLRWYDAEGNWIPTDAEQERQRAEQAEALLAQERQQKGLLAARLRALGINPDDVIGS